MRGVFITLLLLVAVTAWAGEEKPAAWPLWDGKETVQEYAKRVNLPAAAALAQVTPLKRIFADFWPC